MQEVKNARKKLEDKLVPTQTKKDEAKATANPGAKEAEKKFVRVAIQEESDEDEQPAAETPSTTTNSEKKTFDVSN